MADHSLLPDAQVNDLQLRDELGAGEGFLYRYRDLVGARAEWVRQIVVDSSLYFASPATINDPFDCQVRFRADGSPLKMTNNARAMLREQGVPRGKRRRLLRRMPGPKLLAQDISAGFQREVNRMGLLSLSSTHENLLLWSHYAAGHTGVCLQFRVGAKIPYFAAALPVEYARELPIPNLLDDDRRTHAKQLLLTKAEDWSYEREWRYLLPKIGGKVSFPEETLVGVIFGARISESDRALVMSWISLRKCPVRVFSASLDAERFALRFTQIT